MDIGSIFFTLIETFGYVGIFIVSLITASTIFFPLPGDALIFLAGSTFNPLLTSICASLGSTIGELTAYYIGFAGKGITDVDKKKRFKRYKKWFDKHGFLLIPIFAFTPLPMDIIGIICGSLEYNKKKFFVGVLLGKIPRYVILAYAGFFSTIWIRNVFGI